MFLTFLLALIQGFIAAPKPIESLPPLVENATRLTKDRSRIAVVSQTGLISVLEIETGLLMWSSTATHRRFTNAAWNDDASMLAMLASHGQVVALDGSSGEYAFTLPAASSPPPKRFRVPQQEHVRRKIEFAGKTTLVAALGEAPTEIWSVESRSRVTALPRTLQSHDTAFAISRDGDRLAVGTSDATVRVLDVSTGRMIGEVRNVAIGRYQGIHALDFDPSGNTLAIGTADHLVRLWQIGSKEPMRTLAGDDGSWGNPAIGCVRFSGDGTQIVSTSFPYWRVCVGSVASGEMIRCTSDEGETGMRPMPAWFSGDGQNVTTSLGLRSFWVVDRRLVSDGAWWDSDGDYAWAVVDQHLVVRRIPDEQLLFAIPVRGN